VARKKTAIALSKLSDAADGRLQLMLEQLTGNSFAKGGKRAHWSLRFAASGKGFAPKIRIS